jgi:hypothetical protein
MPRVIDAEHVEPVIRAMVGASDVDGGPTPEQLAVIGSLAAGYFEVALDPATIEPLGPEATADSIVDPAARRRMRELLVLVEMCRHPVSRNQMERVEESRTRSGGARSARPTSLRSITSRSPGSHWPRCAPRSASPPATAEHPDGRAWWT